MKNVQNGKYMLFFYLTYMILTKTMIKHDRFQVELLIFSGKENPKFLLDPLEYQTIKDLLYSYKINSKFKPPVMGYKGFFLTNLSNLKCESQIIYSLPTAEKYLLNKLKTNLSDKVYDYIFQQINKKSTPNQLNQEAIINFGQKLRGKDVCENLPIIGSNTIPDFNPDKDAKGCFLKNLPYNNCYNYGNDIVSNTFAQPGRGSNNVWKKITCEEIKLSAESDGLKSIAKEYPHDLPAIGHYVALMVWNGEDYHWLRLDSNGFWSHKPGQTGIRNIDNSGSIIIDPSTQNLYPYNEFCGYFSTIPREIRIK